MKKMILPMIALVVGVCLSAFTANQKHRVVTSTLWQFEPVNSNGPSDPMNYVKLDDTTPFECEGSEIVCQIQADENLSTGKPEIPLGDDPSVQVTKYQTSFRDE